MIGPTIPRYITLTDSDVIINGESFPWYIHGDGAVVATPDEDVPYVKCLMVPILYFTDGYTEFEDRRSA